MKLLESILLMFCEKHDEEAWHARKLELLFTPVNEGPSIFASMMQVYMNIAVNLFEFPYDCPVKNKAVAQKPQLWLRRGALEAAFRLLELARLANHNPQDLLKYSV
jgi:hypothetical protein